MVHIDGNGGLYYVLIMNLEIVFFLHIFTYQIYSQKKLKEHWEHSHRMLMIQMRSWTAFSWMCCVLCCSLCIEPRWRNWRRMWRRKTGNMWTPRLTWRVCSRTSVYQFSCSLVFQFSSSLVHWCSRSLVLLFIGVLVL